MEETKPATITERAKAKTPPFFKKIRNIGLTLTGVSAAIVGAPVVLPAVLITGATYLGVAGTVATVLAQLAKEDE